MTRQTRTDFDFVMFLPAAFTLQKMLGNYLPFVFWQFFMQVSGKFFFNVVHLFF
jgi:hypothetical protein